jgi:uncharacterized protein (TIGR03546 family)
MVLITRKIGKVICGNATPAQLMLAAILGGMVGFMPGLVQAPGTIALLTALLVILNANLVLAAATAIVAQLISLVAMPVSFAIGRALLDGPGEPLFRWAINAPGLALLGLEYYTTTGGLVLGAGLGAIIGVGVVAGVRAFRRRMAGFESNSEAYQRWASKGWVKLLRWALLGGAPKGGFQAALDRHGKVIRPLGVVLVAGVLVLGVVGHFLLADDIVAFALQRGLAQANGATVDVDRAQLSLRQGRLSATGLQLADPNALDRNLFQAETMTANIATMDLLRKRLTLDEVIFTDAATGTKRTTPGRLIGDRPKPSPAPETGQGEKRIDDYLKDWQKLKERLAQARDWLERIGGEEEPTADPAPTTQPDDQKPAEPRPERALTLEERLRRRIAEKGYAHVRARHLIEQVPTVTVRRLEANKVRAVQLDGETLDVLGQHLSTHPSLLGQAPQLRITTTDSDKLLFDLDLGQFAREAKQNQLRFHLKRLPIDRLNQMIQFAGDAPLRGGTMDLSLDGTLQSVTRRPSMDLPLNVSLQNTTVRLGGKSQKIEQLPVTMGLRGPIDHPAIDLDAQQLAKNLARSGAEQLARETVKKHADKLKKQTGLDVNQLLGGDATSQAGASSTASESDQRDATAAVKDDVKQKAEDAAKEKAGDFLKGFLGGNQKED